MSLLEGVGILEVLTESELENLRLFCQEKQLSTGEVLFRDGDEANSMYILKSGKMAVSRVINGVDVHL
jgi:CRP-like cAMP-binding protein